MCCNKHSAFAGTFCFLCPRPGSTFARSYSTGMQACQGYSCQAQFLAWYDNIADFSSPLPQHMRLRQQGRMQHLPCYCAPQSIHLLIIELLLHRLNALGLLRIAIHFAEKREVSANWAIITLAFQYKAIADDTAIGRFVAHRLRTRGDESPASAVQ